MFLLFVNEYGTKERQLRILYNNNITKVQKEIEKSHFQRMKNEL